MAEFRSFDEYFKPEAQKESFTLPLPPEPVKEEKIARAATAAAKPAPVKKTVKKKHSPVQLLYRLSAMLFAGILALLGIISCFDKDKTISEQENRALAKRPAFSFKELFGGSLTVDFENYYSDNFPARSFFIDRNMAINGIFTQFSAGGENAEVVVQRDSSPEDFGGEGLDLVETEVIPENDNIDQKHESVVNGANENEVTVKSTLILTKNSAMEIFSYNESIVQNYADMINNTAKAMPEGVKFYSLVAPTSAEFYGTEKYRQGPHSQYDAIKKIYEKLDDSIIKIDAYSPLNDHADQYIYFRTDHHWTARGAYYAYTSFCKKAGLKYPELSKFKTHRFDGFVGSFYRESQSQALKDNPDYVECFELLVDAKNTVYSNASLTNGVETYIVANKISGSNKYLAFIAGDQPIEKITTSVKNGRKILVIKESYGNAFVPFLCNNYEEVYVIDPRKVSMSLPQFVKDNGIQEVMALNYCMGIANPTYRNALNRITGGN